MGMALGTGKWLEGLYYLIPISAYMMGAFVSELFPNPIKHRLSVRWDTLLILIEMAVIAFLGFVPDSAPVQISQVAINFIASYLYGAHEHHEPIVGNVLIMKMGMTNEGPDILPLNEAETRQVEESMKKIAHIAYRKVLVAFRSVFVDEVEKEADNE